MTNYSQVNLVARLKSSVLSGCGIFYDTYFSKLTLPTSRTCDACALWRARQAQTSGSRWTSCCLSSLPPGQTFLSAAPLRHGDFLFCLANWQDLGLFFQRCHRDRLWNGLFFFPPLLRLNDAYCQPVNKETAELFTSAEQFSVTEHCWCQHCFLHVTAKQRKDLQVETDLLMLIASFCFHARNEMTC